MFSLSTLLDPGLTSHENLGQRHQFTGIPGSFTPSHLHRKSVAKYTQHAGLQKFGLGFYVSEASSRYCDIPGSNLPETDRNSSGLGKWRIRTGTAA
jgi:hypothetical protein